MKKSVQFYLVKVNRISGWLLFVLVPLLLITGYGITGEYGWASALGTAEAHAALHKIIIPYTILIFIIHSCINIYFFTKRWLKKR